MGELDPGAPMAIDPKRVKDIFLEAADLPDEAARTAYLDRACGGDAGLRNRVEALLRSHDPAGSFLGTAAAVVPEPGGDETMALEATPVPTHDGSAQGNKSHSKEDDEPDDLQFLAPSARPDSLGRLGHYEMLQVLGKGGFGIVFRAFDDILQRVVAVKVMAPQLAATSPARKRFLREARSSAAVRHENVVQVYEVGEQPLPYLAMEFIPGETLQQKLDRTGPLDVPEALRIGRQIAEGLAAAHACELIHRDIKPGNVLLEGGQHRVKITDFGLARAADDASISQSGIIAGTPMYMAPEQAKGETLDQRADLFSLGSVLYQMAAGRSPFRASGTLAVLKRVAEDTPRPIREIIPETPQWLCDIISKLHAKNPDDRYQSAREVADVLADCEAQLKAHSKLKDYNRIPRGKSQPSGRRKWVAAAAVLLLPVLALAVTEFAGVTHLFQKQRPTVAITPKDDPKAGPKTPHAPGSFALAFDGQKSLVMIPSLKINEDHPLTVETWAVLEQPADQPKQYDLVGNPNKSGFALGVPGGYGGDGKKLGFLMRAKEPDTYFSVWEKQPLPRHQIIHVAGVYDGKAEIRLFVNGQLQSRRPIQGVKPSVAVMVLGANFGGTNNFLGRMNEVRISKVARYDTDFTPANRFEPDKDTIALYHFDEGEGAVLKDSSGNGHHGDIVGAKWVKADGSPVGSSDADGWVQLFNGKDLTGWKTPPDQPGDWRVVNGALTSQGGTSHLFTDRGDYRNVHVRVEARLDQGSDSGLWFRTEFGVNKVSKSSGMRYPLGYEAHFNYSGQEHDNQLGVLNIAGVRNYSPSPSNPAEWFVMDVIAVDNRIIIKVGGKTTVDFVDVQNRYASGHFALQCGGAGKVSAVHFRKIEIKELPPTSLPPTFKNSLGMEFVKVPKGKSWLGGGKDKLGDKEVEIPADFYLGKYEVTQEEWEKVMGENPSHFSRTGGGKDAVEGIPDADLKRFPVENVSWDQCQLFVAKLNEREKDTGWVYRLPTAAESEYACRGGPMSDRADSMFDFYLEKPSNALSPTQANCNTRLNRTCKVGSYSSNSLGIYDLHGNVREWCADEVPGDPRIPEAASRRVSRGGGWHHDSQYCQAASRYPAAPSTRYQNLGLRLARVPAGAPSPEVKTPPVAAPFTDADVQRIAALPAAEQVEEVRKELMRRNPGFDGKVQHKIENDVVTGIGVLTDYVTDISPIRVFDGLRNLDCSGTITNHKPNGQLADLPLRGMNLADLTRLNLGNTRASDAGLEHFRGCAKLESLHLHGTQAGDQGLANFKDCKNLFSVGLSATQVTDAGLAHFKDCKDLTELNLSQTNVGDAGLAHFAACKSLKVLHLLGTQVTDAGLVHFEGCKDLRTLNLAGTQVSEAGLAHFKDCKELTRLVIVKTQINDLSLLKRMSLKELDCDFQPERDAEILRSIKTLEKINGKPAAEFWKDFDGQAASALLME
jgi:serine/threonine protein kinase/formylglycine-generating enzyme required for sulfatase activity/Leucine-rich repeat (LRR) protein